MRAVHKYIVEPADRHGERNQTMIAEGAKLLSVGFQGWQLMVWALVDPDAKLVRRKLLVMPTGFRVDRPLSEQHFVGTATTAEGLVFHVFDDGEEAS